MIITNQNNLPAAFVKMAEQNESFADNEIRVTTLLNGLREAELKRRYADEIKQDCSDMIWLLFGTAVHKVLEETQEEADELREERLKMKISKSVLTGKSDLFKNGIITDYKTCSVWKVIFGDYEDWRRQLLLYAMLWRNAGFEVKGGQIIAIMKDHSKAKAKLDSSYPQLPVTTISFEFADKDIDEITVWAEKRVKELETIRDMPVSKLPLCTNEERYNSGDKYAVMEKGKKRAKKVCDDYAEAKQIAGTSSNLYVEVRKGEDKKCMEYCMAREFCPYAKELNNGFKI